MENNKAISERAGKYLGDLDDIRAGRSKPGISTGWPLMNEFYTIIPGQLNIFTGYPGHGKSEIVDSIMVRQIVNNKSKILYYSPENWPYSILIRKLVEKMAGNWLNRLESDPFEEAFIKVDEHCRFISASESAYTVEQILEHALELINGDFKLDHLVIDPWNELDSQRPQGMTETDYIGVSLQNIRRFARKYGINVWIVAHPTKPIKDRDGNVKRPTMYDINGSSNWFNKADNGFIAHRKNKKENNEMTLYIDKIKNRYFGSLGEVVFDFKKNSGDYELLRKEGF